MNAKYNWLLPVQASSYAAEIDWGIWFIQGLMIAIFVLWGIFFCWVLWRYRARPGVKADTAHQPLWKSLVPDAIVLAFEIALIVFYAIPGWSRIKMSHPRPEESNVLEVVAEQFAWNVHYPGKDGKFGRRDPSLIDSGNRLGLDREDPDAKDDIVTSELHAPVNRPTLLYLSSKDVIHSFFIPEFRIKQDATPGLRVPVWFTPTLAGKYELACAQLCGNGHATMRSDVQAHEEAEFQAWIEENTPKD